MARIAVVVGSLRKESFNRRLARAHVRLPAGEGHEFVFSEIGDLPLYDQDDDANQPPPTQRLKREIREADGVLFVTPEYNRSVPGVLKNAIDVGSRPYGQAIWSGKPAAVMSTSMGVLGGFGANHHLRQMLTFFDMPVLQQPEAYVGSTHALFDDAGKLANEATEGFFTAFIEAFGRLVERNVPATALAA